MDENTGRRQIRFGIIGCGGIGRWHAKCLSSIPGTALAGVTDIDTAARDRAAQRFGVRAFDSAEALLQDSTIDVISICTPPASHASLILAATDAGKHILVEKPLALDLSEADRVIAACASRHLEFGVVHQQRGRSAAQALHQLIVDGELGRPLMAAAIHTWFRPDSQLDANAWRRHAAEGGGVLLDQAIHGIDLLVWYLGEPKWVSGSTAAVALGSTAEETAVASIGFAGGAMATLAASTSANALRDDIAIELAGSRGCCRLEVRDYDHAEIVRLELSDSVDNRARRLSRREIESRVQSAGGRWRQGPRSWPWRGLVHLVGNGRGESPFRDPRAILRRKIDRIAQLETREFQGHAAILHSMAEAVRGRGRPLVPASEARHSIAIIDAIHRSHGSGGARVEIVGPEKT